MSWSPAGSRCACTRPEAPRAGRARRSRSPCRRPRRLCAEDSVAQFAAAIPQVTRAQVRRRREWLVDLVLLAPGLGYLLVFMCVPLVQVALRGFGLLAIGEPSQFTLGLYREGLANKIDRDSIIFGPSFRSGPA